MSKLGHAGVAAWVELQLLFEEIEATSQFVDGALTGFIQKPFTLLELEAKISESMA